MIAIAALSFVVQAAAPSFADVERNKHTAYRLLADYQDKMTLSVKDGDAPAQTMVIEQRIAKDKLRVVVSMNASKVLEGGYDGVNQWVVSHVEKQFSTTKIAHQWYTVPYRPADYQGSNEPQFDMKFNNGYGVRFDCNPPLKVLSDAPAKVDGADFRLITARVNVPGTTRFMEVKQWFYPDRWVLRKFEVNGIRKDGKKLNVVGDVGTVKFKANSTPADFKMPRPAGYTEIKPPSP